MPTSAGSAFRRMYVQDRDELQEPARFLAGADVVGLDVEMGQRIKRLPGGITTGEQILALIQLAGRDLSLAVDPFRVRDLSPLRQLMSSHVVKVVLGGATDVQLLEERGLAVHNVADLAEMAVSVFGHKEEGMRALASRALGIHIDKTIRREDWLRRPVNPAMLSYAHRDAELTLLLYRWFQENHNDVVIAHTRKHYRPAIPSDVPQWVRKYLSKRLDAVRLLKDEEINQEAETARLVADIRAAQAHDLAPGQQRRLIRLIGELRLSDFYDEINPHLESPSSVFRSAAARTIGRLGDERARPALQRLLEDEIPDVRVAAQLGLRDLNAGPEEPYPAADRSEDPPGLKPEAMAALARLQESMNDHEKVFDPVPSDDCADE
jgi:3'-5' exonuclease/HEAT repeats